VSRLIVRSFFLAVVISAGTAKTFAVWPPSTSFEAASVTSPAGSALTKLEQDEQRLAKIIQEIEDDEAALKANASLTSQ